MSILFINDHQAIYAQTVK